MKKVIGQINFVGFNHFKTFILLIQIEIFNKELLII
jgi:hypothetical protein